MVSLAATLSVVPDRSRREMAKAVNPAIGSMPKGADAMTLLCEVAPGDKGGNGNGDGALAGAIAETLENFSGLKGDVEIARPGSLADDGIVIEDKRGHE